MGTTVVLKSRFNVDNGVENETMISWIGLLEVEGYLFEVDSLSQP